jgi:hypothetical protein
MRLCIELFIVGAHGVLLIGENSDRHCYLLIPFLSLMSRKIFISNFVLRMFVLADQLASIRTLITSHEKDPNSIPKIRSLLRFVVALVCFLYGFRVFSCLLLLALCLVSCVCVVVVVVVFSFHPRI